MQRVNYNEIAPLYDKPLHDHTIDPYLLTFVESHPELVPSAMGILDVGCGTDKQLTANRSRFPDMTMVGVDRFTGMLHVAQQRGPSIAWVNGDGAVLPLHADSFYYACNQFSYPHIQAKEHMVDQRGHSRRKLRFCLSMCLNQKTKSHSPGLRQVSQEDGQTEGGVAHWSGARRTIACSRRPPAFATLRLPGAAEA